MKIIQSVKCVLVAGSLIILFSLSAQDKPTTPPESPKPLAAQTLLGLPPGKDREWVIAQCMRCHSPRLIGAQKLSRGQWEKTVHAMEKNGLLPLPKPIEERILNYLATYCGPDSRGNQSDTGQSSPWATPLYQPNPFW